MHSRIFQVSGSPITEDNLITEDDAFNENHMDYCTFETHFDDDFSWLISELPEGVFEVGDKALTLTDITPLLKDWDKKFKQLCKELDGDMTKSFSRWRVKSILEKPLGDFLFYIEGYTSCTSTSDSFIDWLLTLSPGDTIYFGATFDYHL